MEQSESELKPGYYAVLQWSPERDKIAPKLLRVVTEVENPKAGRTGQEGNRKYKYANLNDFLGVLKGICSDNDILITQGAAGDSSCVVLETELTEVESGQWVKCRLSGTPDEPGLKKYGACISYLRRYALQPLFSLFAEDDTDSASTRRPKSPAGSGGPRSKAQPPPSAPPPEPAPHPDDSAPGSIGAEQAELIGAVMKKQGLTRDKGAKVRAYCKEQFGVSKRDDLSAHQAMELIAALNEGVVAAWEQDIPG